MKLQPFRFREIATEEIGFKKAFQSTLIENVLNQNLNFINYSCEVKAISCFFLIVQPTNTIHKPYKRYLSKSNTIRWVLRLNYEQVLSASLEETTAIMAQTYLETICPYFKKFKYDFDGERFYQDVKQLFVEKEWVVEEGFLV